MELYDLSGNVWEWCRNRHSKPESDMVPAQVDMGTDARRVLRGGSWSYAQYYARAAARFGSTPDARDDSLGFRVVVVRRPPS